jgi:hypothetical protein
MPLAQLDPSIMMIFKADEIARELSEINGVPAKILRDKEEVAEMMAQQQQQAEMQQLLQAAPLAAQSAKTMAETAVLAGNVPQSLPI